jgi:hypothetical protein
VFSASIGGEAFPPKFTEATECRREKLLEFLSESGCLSQCKRIVRIKRIKKAAVQIPEQRPL